MSKTFALVCFALLGVGCALGEEVSDDKSAVAAAEPAAGAGGEPGSSEGGAAGLGAAGAPDDGTGGDTPTSSGGAANAQGGDTGGSAGAPPMCASGEKLCDTGCVERTPEVGCGSVGCTPCNKPPANSKPTCDGALCDFECLPGFVRSGFACVSEQGGGTGGSGGSGGSSGSGGAAAGGSGGGLNVCVAPCTPSDPTSQFLCVAACVSKGGVGLCAPALNCCVCG
ncbi:MAG: hypothetical protein HS104_31365 [Polyangiaceae bacterium]|nr:hypothetical protein [Polyangiaceae bacterium]MCE7891219.1 hypothetical protein [Sorangiineae bacterium PRO1]MCL4750745.1 hypothetical protein [Myxococcales bacterium]